MKEGLAIKDRIVLATVACIERDGIKSVTVRAIAKEAGVNVAAASTVSAAVTASASPAVPAAAAVSVKLKLCLLAAQKTFCHKNK
jgi:DNA-binding transcriptional regulator YbjK